MSKFAACFIKFLCGTDRAKLYPDRSIDHA